MTVMTERLLLLDTASLYFRAFFGVPEVIGPSGVPTNAVRGLLDMIASLAERSRPSHLAACWDNDWRPAFRVAAIPTYKSHRVAAPTGNAADADAQGAPGEAVAGPSAGPAEEEVPDALAVQVPIIIDALAALGVARVGVDGHEADDVIGTLATLHRGQRPIDIVTGDRDLFQLVDDAHEIRVVYTARGGVRNPDLVDEAFLLEKYGIPTGAAYADMAVLRGDTSDGLPGVAGIGEKTAAKLITTYGSLEALRAAIAAGDPAIKGAQRARLEAGADYLDAAPRVVEVVRDAPVGEIDLHVPTQVADPALMSRLAVDHGLTNSFDRVVRALGIG
ncbi:5'-3' exonuclease [Intrasporangium sp.]|uniref:5'-3' exonuclease n=1 Tax=Intrasporangium sp. TaxID=1925024 RepID=UPI00293AFAC5|nr:5'-3' exonuclease [Intrasporangium sp.]MDV3222121.1 5'-3' exonuclease [Intrasporangium sp.]